MLSREGKHVAHPRACFRPYGSSLRFDQRKHGTPLRIIVNCYRHELGCGMNGPKATAGCHGPPRAGRAMSVCHVRSRPECVLIRGATGCLSQRSGDPYGPTSAFLGGFKPPLRREAAYRPGACSPGSQPRPNVLSFFFPPRPRFRRGR